MKMQIGQMTRFAAIRRGGALICALLVSGIAAAQSDAPDIAVTISLDPASGTFTAETVMDAPEGDVILPGAEWLSVDSLRIGATEVDVAGSGVLGTALHRNTAITLSVSGRLPGPQPALAAVASSPEATHVVGPALFPVDDTAIRDHRVTVSLPADHRVAATGSLLSDRADAGLRETRFSFTGRSADLALFVGPYVVAERTHGALRLRTYFETGDSALSDRYFDALARYLDRYEAELGDYAYDGFSVVSAPIPVGLGFAGVTYVSRDILSHPYMTGRSLAHEVLHSWWGNAVGVDYVSGNWAEGLTTFQADYALAEDEGPEAARDMRIGWIRDLAALPEGAMRPLTAFRSASHALDQSEGYGKAALVFHMLRDEIGPEAFGAGLRRFYRDNLNRLAGWQDLQRAFEAKAGRDLGWFFDQWVTRAGLPRVDLAGAALDMTAEGVTVTLEVVQDAPAYRLRLPVVFEMPSGQVERRLIEVAGVQARVEVALPAPPRSVRIDPEFDLARQPLAGELAPILGMARGMTPLRAVAATPGDPVSDAIAQALLPVTGRPVTDWQSGLADSEGAPATLIAGRAEDVAAQRPGHLGPLPVDMAAGDTRLWIERDAAGALWLFLSYDDPASVAADLRALRFYTGQSHVAFGGGRALSGGVWPVRASALGLRLDEASGDGVAP
jgi:hypothetical protein